mmetsp:Transcript_4710/g.7605  ORF Transcript_4710/g.7605 Transcript_4710/m.7605 type:complete len:249 (-) Transcript_4710:479-1225(-)
MEARAHGRLPAANGFSDVVLSHGGHGCTARDDGGGHSWLCTPRVPLACQPWLAPHRSLALVCHHGLLCRLLLQPHLQALQGRGLDAQHHPDGVPLSFGRGDYLFRARHVPPVRGFIRRCAVFDLLHPHRVVVRRVNTPCVHWLILWVQEGGIQAPSARQSHPSSDSSAALVHASDAHGALRWYPAVRCGECGALLHHECPMVAPGLLHLRLPLLGHGHPRGHLRRDHDPHVLLPALQRGLPLVVAQLA